MKYLGNILVAHPLFPSESPFSKSVIYIYQDDSVNGTTGVIINKPTRTTVSMLCENNGVMFGDTTPLMHSGGPVNQSALIVLHSDEWNSSNTAAAGSNLRISSDNHMFMKMSQGNVPAYWRAFFGYASWAPGQLESEVKGKYPYDQQMWLTAKANDSILFDYSGDRQWNKALELCSQQMIDSYI